MIDESAFDLTGGAFGYRFRVGIGRKQPLPKAVGMSAGKTPNIVDATAGFGRDALLLASLGAHVTLVERSSIVHGHLKRSLERAAAAGDDFASAVSRMTLIHGDAKDLLPSLDADVVMVDPMHPSRKNSALVKKDMRLLRELVGSDSDALQLMQVALATARSRVVLKWPLRAEGLPGLPRPSHQISGQTVRYDVFMIRERDGRDIE